MALIGISAKKQHGKDTVANIINYLTWVKKHRDYQDLSYEEIKDFAPFKNSQKPFEIKRFADKLKDMVCLIIGCEREQLEDETFKNTPLGEEWKCYYLLNPTFTKPILPPQLYVTREEAEEALKPFTNLGKGFVDLEIVERPMTPRLMLQLIGTEGGRNLLHPNVWVNSLMGEYKPVNVQEGTTPENLVWVEEWPSWIIPDMRFPNELERVKKEGGISIRVVRPGDVPNDEHESEVALDNSTFDYVIINDGSLNDLIYKVKTLLLTEGLL